MRKNLVIVFCLLLSGYFCQAQVFKGEIIGGINITQLDGDYKVGYKKAGAHAGIGVMFPFNFVKGRENKPWAVSMEILFNQRGVRARNYNYNPKDTTKPDSKVKMDYHLKMNYVSLPVMLHYTEKDFITFGLGFAYNRMFSVSEVEFDVPQTYDSIGKLSSNDFSVLVDVRLRIWQQLKFGFRFEYSMFSLRTRYFPRTDFHLAGDRKQYNNTLSFYLVYMLNEKKTDYRKKKQELDKRYYYSEAL